MSVKYKELEDFTRKIEDLNKQQKEEFMKACCKELAARLLKKVRKRTKPGNYENKVGGTLRRGWTSAKTGDSKRDTTQAMYDNLFGSDQKVSQKNMSVRKEGNTYIIDVTNAVEYAAYVEYGHRKRNHQGWVPGKFMLTISEAELRTVTPQILERKLQKFLEDAMK